MKQPQSLARAKPQAATASTSELILAAQQALQEFNDATTNMTAAGNRLEAARNTLVAANQALHDDLAANGPAVLVDSSTTPPTVVMYVANDPDTYTATPIRVAA